MDVSERCVRPYACLSIFNFFITLTYASSQVNQKPHLNRGGVIDFAALDSDT